MSSYYVFKMKRVQFPRELIQTRTDQLTGVDTGWCRITMRGADRVQGSHTTQTFTSHVAHFWMFDIPPGAYVRVTRGYVDGRGVVVVTSDTVHYNPLVTDCGGMGMEIVPFPWQYDARDYDDIADTFLQQ